MTAGPPTPGRGTAPVRMVFFGSGAFAVPILEALGEAPGIDLVAVVTTPDRPAGRHGRLAATPVAVRAEALGVAVLRPSSLRAPDAAREIATLGPELAVLADYGRIVPPDVLALPRLGFLNVHPSLLPRHRGATPIAGAILAGDAATGVTVFRMDAGLDTGPIVSQVEWPLPADATAAEVEAESARRGADLLRATLQGWLAGDRRATPQVEAAATLTRAFRRGDGRLDPSLPASMLERRVRALAPWPGTFLETAEARLAVLRAAVAAGEPGDPSGALVADGDGLALATADGRLRLLEVRLAGGRDMSGAELRRGRPALVGQVLQGASDVAPDGAPGVAVPVASRR